MLKRSIYLGSSDQSMPKREASCFATHGLELCTFLFNQFSKKGNTDWDQNHLVPFWRYPDQNPLLCSCQYLCLPLYSRKAQLKALIIANSCTKWMISLFLSSDSGRRSLAFRSNIVSSLHQSTQGGKRGHNI